MTTNTVPADTTSTHEHSRLADADWLELTPDEDILWTGRPTRWTHAGAYLGGAVLIVLGAGVTIGFERLLTYLDVSLTLPPWARFVPLVLAVMSLWMIGVPSLRRLRTRYVVTTEEVYVKRGIVSRDVDQMRLERIQNTSCDQSLLERLLSYGTVVLYTAGSDTVEIVFENVPDPTEVNRTITRALDAAVTPRQNQAGKAQNRTPEHSPDREESAPSSHLVDEYRLREDS